MVERKINADTHLFAIVSRKAGEKNVENAVKKLCSSIANDSKVPMHSEQFCIELNTHMIPVDGSRIQFASSTQTVHSFVLCIVTRGVLYCATIGDNFSTVFDKKKN